MIRSERCETAAIHAGHRLPTDFNVYHVPVVSRSLPAPACSPVTGVNGPRVFCGLADLRTNQRVFCGPKNADCVCGPVGKMRTCQPLKFQLFS